MSNEAFAIVTTLAVFCVLLIAVVVYLTRMLVRSYHIYQKIRTMLRAQRNKIASLDNDIDLRDNTLRALLMVFLEVLYGDPKSVERRTSLLRSDMSLLEIKSNANTRMSPMDICEMMMLTEGEDMDKTLDTLHQFFEKHLSMDADLREHMSTDDELALEDLVEIIDCCKRSREELHTSVDFDHALIDELIRLTEPTPAEIA